MSHELLRPNWRSVTDEDHKVSILYAGDCRCGEHLEVLVEGPVSVQKARRVLVRQYVRHLLRKEPDGLQRTLHA